MKVGLAGRALRVSGAKFPGTGTTEVEITAVEVAGGQLTLTFPIAAGRTYSLETSLGLESWIPQPSAVFTGDGATGSLSFPAEGQPILFGRGVGTVA